MASRGSSGSDRGGVSRLRAGLLLAGAFLWVGAAAQDAPPPGWPGLNENAARLFAPQGWMSQRSWAGQPDNIGAIFTQIVERLDATALLVSVSGVPMISLDLSRDAIEQPYRAPDPRIQRVLGPGDPIPLAGAPSATSAR